MWKWDNIVKGSGEEGDMQRRGKDKKDRNPCTNACIIWRVNEQLQANMEVQASN